MYQNNVVDVGIIEQSEILGGKKEGFEEWIDP